MRRQLDSRDDELAEMTRGREVALKENRRLQTDLNTMTEEHQVSEYGRPFVSIFAKSNSLSLD